MSSNEAFKGEVGQAHVDKREVIFLALKFLASVPQFASLVPRLETEALENGLLPSRVDVIGCNHACSLASLTAQLPHVPHDALSLLLGQLLQLKQHDGVPGSEGITSLLGLGRHSLLRSLQVQPVAAAAAAAADQSRPGNSGHVQASAAAASLPPGQAAAEPSAAATAPAAIAGPAAVSKLSALQQPAPKAGSCSQNPQVLVTFKPHGDASKGPSAWLHPPHSRAGLVHRLMLREALGRKVANPDRTLLVSRHTHHLKTCRGHKNAVYCVTFDNSGQRVITGSDDWLVKIWAFHTGQLLKTCRGHDSEINDLAVSADNSLAASAANDRTIRVWSLQDATLGFPVSVLLGHEAPVTYLDFSPTMPQVLLSSSFDGTCRLWNAADGGTPAVVLRPGPSFGMPRSTTDQPRRLSRHAPPPASAAINGADSDAGLAAADGDAAGSFGIICCGFSPDGAFIVAGCTDCNTYVWQWGAAPRAGGRGSEAGAADGPAAAPAAAAAGSSGAAVAPDAPEALSLEEGHRPVELVKLQGHKNDIIFLEFSHQGHAFVTAAKDGCVRVWRQGRNRSGRYLPSWYEAAVLACPPDQVEVQAARQRRRAPQNASINQVVWTADDRRVVAAVTDNSVRVWDAETGSPLHLLRGHTSQAHIVQGHPTDPHLVMSAGYDGLTVLWNVFTGTAVRCFSTQDTCPLPRARWTDPLQLVDGHWSPDGSSIVVTDVAGQLHTYSTGSADMMVRAPYDQFFSLDYKSVTRDLNGFIIDTEAQRPPHLLTQQLLCDMNMVAYENPLQSAFQQRRLNELLPKPDKLNRFPPGLESDPPTMTAAAWSVMVRGATAHAVQAAIERASERHREAMDAFAARERRRAALAAAGVHVRPRGAQQQRRRRTGRVSLSGAAPAAATVAPPNGQQQANAASDHTRAYLGYVPAAATQPGANQPDLATLALQSRCWDASDDGEDGSDQDAEEVIDLEDDDHDHDRMGPIVPRRARQVIAISSDDASSSHDEGDEDYAGDEFDDDDDFYDGEGMIQEGFDGGSVDEDDDEDAVRQRVVRGGVGRDGMVLRPRRRVHALRQLRADQQQRRQQQRASIRIRTRSQAAAAAEAGSEEEAAAAADEEATAAAGTRSRPRPSSRRSDRSSRKRSRRERPDEEAADEEEPLESESDQELQQVDESDDEFIGDDEDGWSDDSQRKAASAQRRSRRIAGAAAAAAHERRESRHKRRRQQAAGGSSSRARQQHQQASRRPVEAYKWLQASTHSPECYVPQLGDEVVYLREGHEIYLNNMQDKRTPRPWLHIRAEDAATRTLRLMRPAEPCRVVDVEYVVADDGSRSTVPRLTLELLDSPLARQQFVMQLPSPRAGHAEFLILRCRFLAAVARQWNVGDLCKNFQMDNDGGGCWYTAIVVDTAAPAGTSSSLSQASDPYAQPGLWERYGVKWGSQLDRAPAAQQVEARLSPWEMLDAGTSWEHLISADPKLSASDQALAAQSLQALRMHQRRFTVFERAPLPHEAYPDRDGDMVYYNSVVPLPLSLAEVEARLSRGYYRQLEAFRHDIGTIAANAALYNGPGSGFAEDGAVLRDIVLAVLDGRPDPTGGPRGGLDSRPRSRSRRNRSGALLDQTPSQSTQPGADQGAVDHGLAGFDQVLLGSTQPYMQGAVQGMGDQLVSQLPPMPPPAMFPPLGFAVNGLPDLLQGLPAVTAPALWGGQPPHEAAGTSSRSTRATSRSAAPQPPLPPAARTRFAAEADEDEEAHAAATASGRAMRASTRLAASVAAHNTRHGVATRSGGSHNDGLRRSGRAAAAAAAAAVAAFAHADNLPDEVVDVEARERAQNGRRDEPLRRSSRPRRSTGSRRGAYGSSDDEDDEDGDDSDHAADEDDEAFGSDGGGSGGESSGSDFGQRRRSTRSGGGKQGRGTQGSAYTTRRTSARQQQKLRQQQEDDEENDEEEEEEAPSRSRRRGQQQAAPPQPPASFSQAPLPPAPASAPAASAGGSKGGPMPPQPPPPQPTAAESAAAAAATASVMGSGLLAAMGPGMGLPGGPDFGAGLAFGMGDGTGFMGMMPGAAGQGFMPMDLTSNGLVGGSIWPPPVPDTSSTMAGGSALPGMPTGFAGMAPGMPAGMPAAAPAPPNAMQMQPYPGMPDPFPLEQLGWGMWGSMPGAGDAAVQAAAAAAAAGMVAPMNGGALPAWNPLPFLDAGASNDMASVGQVAAAAAAAADALAGHYAGRAQPSGNEDDASAGQQQGRMRITLRRRN